MHSTTKYLNGHSDVVGGAVVARDPALHEQLAWWANCLGLTGAPFDSFLTLRGIRTLHHAWSTTAAMPRRWPNGSPAASRGCRRCGYPGLPGASGTRARPGASRRASARWITLELAGGHEAVREFVARP